MDEPEPSEGQEPPVELTEPINPPVDLSEQEGFPSRPRRVRREPDGDAAFPREDPMLMPVNVQPPAQAKPGGYVCVHENVGEHPVLGVLRYQQDYDYSQEHNPAVLEAIAACVASGYLKKA